MNFQCLLTYNTCLIESPFTPKKYLQFVIIAPVNEKNGSITTINKYSWRSFLFYLRFAIYFILVLRPKCLVVEKRIEFRQKILPVYIFLLNHRCLKHCNI